MWSIPTPPETPATPARGVVRTELHHNDTALDRHKLDLRCRMLEIERRCAVWRCEEYRNLLERFISGVGHAPAAEPEGRQQPVASSSRSAPATPSPEPASQQPHQPLPNLVAQQGDDGRERHQRTGRTLAPPEFGPPEIVRRGSPENAGVFVGTIAALCADNSPHNRTAIFSAAGLGDHQLAPQEAACAGVTPDIPWKTFARVFGGWMYAERPMGRRVQGYMGNFLCPDHVTQPFASTRIGEPGVILFSPGIALLEDTMETFHVLVDLSAGQTKTKLRYCGIYTKVRTPYMEVQIDEWYTLTIQCRRKLLQRLRKSMPGTVHARCNLRKRFGGSDPSPEEIREWVRKYRRGSEVMEYNVLQDAFDSGTEKFGFEVIRCVGYDMRLAELIQKETSRRSYSHYQV